ncbi:hypothetical protein D8674_002830 [Pyrus ussuriensis x Pyrus communis]|uniref:Transmembrane protein n=1 Tax=Pyrus ussuriensis x Pyrus communis TaxID=2448454 RepID=A0A5N5FFD8_9ROSA|nr:hypothetical protein D8674_002830 [Pyrus ussuriensis x Pyrus communis]
MVHKANVVYMISIILLLLFSSKLVFANVSENPKHIIADVAEKISRSHLQIVTKTSVRNPMTHGYDCPNCEPGARSIDGED